MKVTIAKALNHKNRLVGEKGRLRNLVVANNSRLETAKTNYDPAKLFADYEAVVEKLVATKTAIAKANVAIYEKIYRISELKAKASELRQIPTDDSDHEDRRWDRKAEQDVVTIIKRVVHLKNVDIDEKIKAIEKEIEALHDEVTAFNYSTTIEVPE